MHCPNNKRFLTNKMSDEYRMMIQFHINNLKSKLEYYDINTTLRFNNETLSYLNVNENDMSLLSIIQHMRNYRTTELFDFKLNEVKDGNISIFYLYESRDDDLIAECNRCGEEKKDEDGCIVGERKWFCNKCVEIVVGEREW
jgi:hypothetical protein